MSGRHRGPVSPDPGVGARISSAARWWAAATVVVLVAAALVVFHGVQNPGSPWGGTAESAETAEPRALAGPSTSLVTTRSDAPSSVTGGAPATLGTAPGTLRIPALGLHESLITLGLNADRTVEVPTDYSRAGWYEYGPAPGEAGSAVILGHVDSHTGPAVFHRLHELAADDVVDVDLADGGTVHFAVTAVETYLKTEFPAERVYGPDGETSLQLVTCGGVFDSAAGSYVSNVVVYTSLVGITPPGTER